jgi:hypothetical protein
MKVRRDPDAPLTKPVARPPIVLASEGLRVGQRVVSFGVPADLATNALKKALGKPTGEGANEECTGGPMTYAQWDEGFYVWFSDGKFAGWDDRGTYRTESGLRIGSARAEVDALPGLSVEDSSLGTEFSSGHLGGLLASEAADAKVTALWGGHSCAVR